MSDRHRVRTMIVAVSGGVILLLGCATATADSNYPLGSGPGRAAQDGPNKQAEKAEKYGGGATSKLVDLGASIVRCGLNVAVPSVRCDL
ncbi:hypothetical protein ACWDSJ_30885 [Nocardia sp. NPDC003482]|uniref:hypothetical protein n=1 Tax=Nocardia sp. NPDC004068 TaxID=3364303 RepID=UPI00367799D8